MKRKWLNILFLAFIFAIFLTATEVKADDKKTLGVCSYNIDTAKLGISDNIPNLKLDVTVYSDGSTDNRRIYGTSYPDTEFSYEPSNGLFLLQTPTIIMSYNEMFDNNGDFYQAYVKYNNCPDMQIINTQNSGYVYLNFYVDGRVDPANNPSYVAQAESTGGEVEAAETITYCNERQKSVRNSDNNLYLTTTETNGVRRYQIKLGGEILSADYNEELVINGFIFRFNEADYDTYWSDECQTAPIFLWAPEEHDRIIQTTKPSDLENGSYGVGDAKNDYGYELLGAITTIEGINSDNWNKAEVQCDDIFKLNEEGSVGWILNTIFNYIKVIGPVLVVLLSAVDFIKAVVGSDEKAMKKAQSKLVIRLIAAVALFLIPTLVQLLLQFINVSLDPECFLQ